MTEPEEVRIMIKRIRKECQCCFSESNIFVEYECEHLICLKCQVEMIKNSSRESCLYCDPLNITAKNNNHNNQEIIDNNSSDRINRINNDNDQLKNVINCNIMCIGYTSISAFVIFLLIILFIGSID